MKDVAWDFAQCVAEDVFGAAKDARRCSSCRVVHRHLPAAEHMPNTRVPPPTPHAKDVAQGAEMGAQLGSSVAFGSYSGKALPGVPRKAPLCSLKGLWSIFVLF